MEYISPEQSHQFNPPDIEAGFAEISQLVETAGYNLDEFPENLVRECLQFLVDKRGMEPPLTIAGMTQAYKKMYNEGLSRALDKKL